MERQFSLCTTVFKYSFTFSFIAFFNTEDIRGVALFYVTFVNLLYHL